MDINRFYSLSILFPLLLKIDSWKNSVAWISRPFGDFILHEWHITFYLILWVGLLYTRFLHKFQIMRFTVAQAWYKRLRYKTKSQARLEDVSNLSSCLFDSKEFLKIKKTKRLDFWKLKTIISSYTKFQATKINHEVIFGVHVKYSQNNLHIWHRGILEVMELSFLL